MNEELEAFERIKRYCVFPYVDEIRKQCLKDLDIIENVVKENKELKRQNFNLLCNNGELREKCKDNEKKLKAFEMVRQNILKITPFEDYGCTCIYIAKPTKEEYEVLEEVLL